MLFSDSFCQFLSQQKGASKDGGIAAINLQTIPSFYAKISEKSLFISAKTYEKFIVCKDYCIAHHDDKTCSLHACKYHIILLGEIENCYMNWIHFVSPINTWTAFIPCSSTDSAEKLLPRVETCSTISREQSFLTKETQEWTKCRVMQKRGSFKKKFKQHFLSALQKTNQRRPVVQCLQKELKKSKRLNLNWN